MTRHNKLGKLRRRQSHPDWLFLFCASSPRRFFFCGELSEVFRARCRTVRLETSRGSDNFSLEEINRGPRRREVGALYSNFSDNIFDVPSSASVTPYNTSAASIVALL